MLLKLVFSTILLTMAILTPSASAGRSDRYDPYNKCGAPFCGSTGNAAGAGALARMTRNATTNTDISKSKFEGNLPKM